MDSPVFDYKEARRQCMRFGLRVGVCWTLSFLLTVWGMRYPLVGDCGLFVGLLSVWYAGRLLRGYAWSLGGIPWMRAWWMAMLTYVFVSLLTTFLQFVYLRWLDGGFFAEAMERALMTPSYRRLIEGYGGGDMDELMGALGDVSRMTYGFLVFNLMLGLVLSLPTAVMARFGLGRGRGKQ